MKFNFLILFLVTQTTALLAQTTAIASTNWSVGSTWSTGIVPGSTTDVIIPSGINVTVDGAAGAQGNCRDINIEAGGTLTLGVNRIQPRRSLTCNGTLSASDNTARINPTGTTYPITIGGNFTTIARLQISTDAQTTIISSGSNVTVGLIAGGNATTLQIDGTLTVSGSATTSLTSTSNNVTINGTLNLIASTFQTAGVINGPGTIALTPTTTGSASLQTSSATASISIPTLNITSNTGSGSANIMTGSVAGSSFSATTVTIEGAAAGSGTVSIGHVSANSSVNITNLANNAKGTVTFNAGSTYGTINNVTINNDVSGRNTVFKKDISINNLTMTLGRIQLDNNVVLSINNSVSGGAATSYIYTSGIAAGQTAFVRGTNIPTAGMTFPTGGNGRYYPITITPTASGADISVKALGPLGGTNVPANFTVAALDLTKTVLVDYVLVNNGAAAVTANLGFTFGTADPGANYVATSPKTLVRSTGGAWSQVTGSTADNATASATATSIGTGTQYYGITAEGGLMTGIMTIPVELMSFTGKNNGKTNLLTWATASEKNNAVFQIERSDDGLSFKTIGSVKGNGTTNTTKYYTFSDDAPLSMNYYRLNQVDNDGISTRSKIVSIARNGLLNSFKIYPSVSEHSLTVETDAEVSGDLLVQDVMGRLWLQEKISPIGQTTVNIQKLPRGTYFLTVKMAKLQMTEKFVKN